MLSEDKEKWSDEQLFEAIRKGDKEALTVVATERMPYLLRLLGVLCRSRNIEEDVATTIAYQTINQAAEQAMLGPISTKPEQVTWLQHLAIQGFRRWISDNPRILRPPPEEATSRAKLSPSERKRQKKLVRLLRKYVQWIKPDHQQIIGLVLMDGLTVEDAGKSMELAIDDALSLFHDAHDTLISFIETHGNFDIIGGGLDGGRATPPRPKRPPRPKNRKSSHQDDAD